MASFVAPKDLSGPITYAIDFGTSNSLLAATDGTRMTSTLPLDPEAEDATILRSVLFFPNQNLCHYGQKAINEYCDNQGEGRLIRSIKKYLPMESYIGSWIEDRVVRLEDLISYFLLEMRKRANHLVGKDVDSVLLGRPAKFSDDPIKDKLAQYRLQKAAELAGFKHVDFLPEPLAAAFELRRKLKEMKTVLVVDLGGGTSDFTVIRLGPKEFAESDVLALGGISVAGDVVDGEFMKGKVAPHFGSKVSYRVPMSRNILEMPKSLLDHICSPPDIAQLRKNDVMEFYRNVQKWAIRPEDQAKLHRLFVLVEDQLGFQLFEEIDRCKRGFSDKEKMGFDFDYPEIEVSFECTKEEFDELIESATTKILNTLDNVLKEAQLSPDKVDLVYCTGGTSKLELIQEGLRQRFSPEKIVKNNFFHSVIEGLIERAKELQK